MITQVSRASLARIYAAGYQGRVARACLALNPGSLTVESTTAAWDAAEITSQASYGYARVVWTIPGGAFSTTDDLFLGQAQNAVFTANSSPQGLQYDSLYVVTGTVSGGVTTWETYVEQLRVFSPSEALPSGLSITYPVELVVDQYV